MTSDAKLKEQEESGTLKKLFTLTYIEKGLISNSKVRVVFGAESDAQRSDWAFSLMLGSKWNQNGASKIKWGGEDTSRTKSMGASA